jgi:hypothetical protein
VRKVCLDDEVPSVLAATCLDPESKYGFENDEL